MSDLSSSNRLPQAERPAHTQAGGWPRSQAVSSRLESLDLAELFGMLRRHVRLILAVAGATLAVAALVLSWERPEYRASAVLRLADARYAVAGGFEQTGDLGWTDPFLSELEILESRTLVGQVVDAEGLRLRPLDDFDMDLLRDVQVAEDAAADTLELRFSENQVTIDVDGQEVGAEYGAVLEIHGIRLAVVAPPEVETAVLTVIPRAMAIDWLLEHLDASPRDPTNLIDVFYVADHPVTAQRVLARIITTFAAANADHAHAQSRRRREFLEQQIARTDSILEEKQLALSTFRSRNQLYSAQGKFEVQQASLIALQMRRGEIDADYRMYRSLLAGLQRSRSGEADERLRALLSAPGIATNPILNQLYEQLTRYQTERDTLTTGRWARSTEHPDVERLDSLITATEAKLTSAVRGHLATLEAHLAALGDLESRNAAETQILPQTEAEEVRLVQQVETVRQVGDRLREEYQKAQIAEAVEVGQVEVVDTATLPYHPASTGRTVKLGFALILGLLLGSGSALAAEFFNPSIRRYREIPTSFDLPQMAVIPRLDQPARPRRGYLRLGRAHSNGNGRNELENGGNAPTLPQIHSAGVEAFRTLRTNLMFSRHSQGMRAIVITSAFPQEGKSTTAANLAVAFAQQGVRTLLVDADLRRPKLHQMFHMVQAPGLSSLLEGRYSPAEAIRTTSIDDLYLMPSGSLPTNPAELLGGERMRRLLLGFPGRIGLLIVDSPPLLAAAEASVLAAEADAVLLVVRAGQTARGAVQQAMEQLDTVGARVVGAVLNDPNAEVPRYGDYYHAHGYYADTTSTSEGADWLKKVT